MSAANTTMYLKNYLPPVFAVTSVNLTIDLYEEYALITNEMVLNKQHDGELFLHGDAELQRVEMNGSALPDSAYTINNGLIITHKPLEKILTLKITTKIYPQNNTKLSGLYRTQNLFCTQCEAEGFRHITFFPDRPDVLSTYTTKISADKALYPTLLSNGNLVDSGNTPDGRHWVVWHDPFKKPSYLFALVAGQLALVRDTFTTCSGKSVDLRIYVEPGNEDKCAHAMTSLKNAMQWDEKEFGREYDLDIFMIVAVSDFNMGAMENKGLNIFNAKYILARPDTATDADYAHIENVVAHEYFHNWTGNRVTCRDWFQLSLKEGLTVYRDQEFSRDMNSRDVRRIGDVRTLQNIQFPEDAGCMAHPVQPSAYQEINNFYTPTIYNKGAEVIRMQQELLGKDGFRRGMDLYFQRHDGQAVTVNDFVCAMEDANTVDFSQFRLWYTQAGTPTITLIEYFENGVLSLAFEQSCPVTPDGEAKKPFHIPIRIALFSPTGEKLPIDNDLLELRAEKQLFHFKNLAQKPYVSILRDFSAPVLIQRQLTNDEQFALLRFESNGFAKWDAAQQLAKQCINLCYHDRNDNWLVPQPLLDAYKQILTDLRLDESLRAELLTPPSVEELITNISNVDIVRLEAVRDFFRATIGKYLFNTALEIYNKLWQQEDHSMHGIAYGRRKLRNLCLYFMMKADEEKTLKLCQQQFAEAKTMTDQIASFALLVNATNTKLRQNAIASFYQQWRHDQLALDKWFTIQASCEHQDTLMHIADLLTHTDFSFTNPNKVRAVISAFSNLNARNFHAHDGRGYTFLADMILKIDPINPQIASRLAIPFTRWRHLETRQQTHIKAELARLDKATLSRDTRELVMKSLS